MPAVSVVVVFHRDTPFLRPAIASVLGQTWPDFELILVDNGARVAAGSLGELADPRIRWVRREQNGGIAAGNNAGVAAAAAPLIALLDHDDLMAPARLERQLAELRARPELALLGSAAQTIDAAGRGTGREFTLGPPAAHRAYSDYHSGAIMPSFTGRTEVFRSLPFRAEFRWASDFDFMSRVVERHTVAALPEVLLHYRRHAQQTTRAHRAEQVLEECYVRLLAQRRRRGADEACAAVFAELRGRAPPASAHAVHVEFARRYLEENLPEQAVYQARRMVATRPRPQVLAAAVRILILGTRRTPGRAGFLLRLFTRGPVRALGLRRVR